MAFNAPEGFESGERGDNAILNPYTRNDIISQKLVIQKLSDDFLRNGSVHHHKDSCGQFVTTSRIMMTFGNESVTSR